VPARPNQKFVSGERGIEFALLPFLPSKLANMGRPIFIQKFLGVPNVTVQLLNMLTVSTLVVVVYIQRDTTEATCVPNFTFHA